MALSSKAKKIIAVTTGATLLALVAISMTTCSHVSDERDDLRQKVEKQNLANKRIVAELDSVRKLADRQKKAIDACDDARGAAADSIDVLNDSIMVLNQKLGQRKVVLSKSAPRRPAAITKKKPVKTARRDCNQNVVPSGQVSVMLNGSDGNTVNINNGVVNNYYVPVRQKCDSVISRSGAATAASRQTIIVTRTRCR